MFYIYRITNLVNGKTYIGQHRYKDLNDDYMGSGVLLLKAQKKYGIENFKKEILVFNIPRDEQANTLEETFIKAEREKVGRENCYNIADGGYSSGMKGKHLTEEHKKKLSEALKGRPSPNKGKHISDKTKKKISDYNKGKTLSEEHKMKIAETLKGHNVSEETREKLSAHKGWHHTEATKKKMSETHKGIPGRPMSEETKRKLSEANKKENLSEETLKKRSEAVKGKKWFNNGEINVMSYGCPEGFVPGRIYQRKKEGR